MFGEMRKYNLRTIEKVLSALAEPNRLRCLAILSSRKLAVCEIREILGLSFSTVSKHLSILQEAGLIEFAKDGKWVNYRLAGDMDPEIKDLLDKTLSLILSDPRIKNDLRLARTVDKKEICGLRPVKNRTKYSRRNTS